MQYSGNIENSCDECYSYNIAQQRCRRPHCTGSADATAAAPAPVAAAAVPAAAPATSPATTPAGAPPTATCRKANLLAAAIDG